MLAASLSPVLAVLACLLVFRLARARAGGMRAVAAAIIVWWASAIGGTIGGMLVLLALWPSGRSLALSGCLAAEVVAAALAVLVAMRIYGRPLPEAPAADPDRAGDPSEEE